MAFTCLLWVQFQPSLTGMQFQERHAWEPAIGLQYHVGIDGLGLLMLAISSIVILMSCMRFLGPIRNKGQPISLSFFFSRLAYLAPSQR